MKNLLFILYFSSLIACQPPAPDLNKDGGTRYVLQIDTAGLTKEQIKASRDNVLSIIAKRLDRLGVANLTLESLEGAQIRLAIPGKYDVQRLRKLLQSRAKLSFCETYSAGEMAGKLSALNQLLEAEQNSGITEGADSISDPLFSVLKLTPATDQPSEDRQLQNFIVLGVSAATDTARVNGYLRSNDAKNVVGADVKFLWTFKPVDQQQRLYELIAVKTKKGKGALSGDIIQEARKVVDDQTTQPQISVTMTPDAATIWKELTNANKGRAIAIVIDDQVYSYPTVQEEISGGQSTISGNFTQQEADDFVNVLQAGSLPVRLSIVSEELVSPGSRQ